MSAAHAGDGGPIRVMYLLDTNAVIAVLKNQPVGVRTSRSSGACAVYPGKIGQ
jgi:hypothetical protein